MLYAGGIVFYKHWLLFINKMHSSTNCGFITSENKTGIKVLDVILSYL